MRTPYILLLGLIIILSSCKQDDDGYEPQVSDLDLELEALLLEQSQDGTLGFYILPDSDDYSNIPQDPMNPITAAKVRLGQLLVHETATGGNPKMKENEGMFACASCHPVAAGFFSGARQGIGEGGSGFGTFGEARVMMPSSEMPEDSVDILPIKVPTLLNVAYQEVALWNGSLGGSGINAPFAEQNAEDFPDNLRGMQGLEVQGMVGQDAHRLKIDTEFVEKFGYKELFDAAFPDLEPEQRYSRETGGMAIASFNRTVLANRAPWQDWLRGDRSALTEDQKNGAVLFFSKARCFECHTGPALKSMEFHAFGMDDLGPARAKSFKRVASLGRGDFTGRPEDNFKFKVPTLYNLKNTPFYGHGASFTDIRSVVAYKNRGVPQQADVPESQLAEQFGNLDLSREEIDLITDFIENGLYDPDLVRYVPESVLSGNCIPNNDPQSRIDLGCED